MRFIIKGKTAEELSPSVRELIDKQSEPKEVSNDARIYWKDVKTAFPEIAEKLKFLFGGKAFITVGELKKKLVEEKDELFWVSEDFYNYQYGQARLQDIYEKNQEVLQLNLSPDLINKIRKDSLFTDFFSKFSRLMAGSPHPVHSQTIGWIRYYMFPDFWVIEEIQSDLFGEDTRLRNFANSDVKSFVEDYTDDEKKKLEKFLTENFKDWDKKLTSTLMNMARRKGARDIWIFDEDIKKEDTDVSPSKLKHFYRRLPRDLGFKRDKLKIGSEDWGAWHRVVAAPVSGYVKACLLTTLADVVFRRGGKR